MSHYKYHVFFCTNLRNDGRASCGRCNAGEIRDYAKSKIKKLRLSGEGKVRINTAGCLDRCDLGPVLVIYPEETWYSYVDRDDIDEIIQKHLCEGEVVNRLLIDSEAKV